MIRFSGLAKISSGIPYANSDFTTVLQSEHLKSYKSYLDTIVLGSFTNSNSGIILSGFEYTQHDSSNDRISLTNSLVYIDGEFYKKDPAITLNYYQFTKNTDVYITVGPTISELRKTRDLVINATASITRYFQISQTPTNVPHIKFSQSGTSRYYRRILKYFLSRPDDIYTQISRRSFDVNGIGYNDMEGFVLINGVNHPYNTGGRFLRGWRVGQTQPDNLNLGGIGGSMSHRIQSSELAQHKHTTTGVIYKAPDNEEYVADMSHYHWMNSNNYFQGPWASPYDNLLNSDSPTGNEDLSTINTNHTEGESKLANYPFLSKETTGSNFAYFGFQNVRLLRWQDHIWWTGGVKDYDNSQLATHKHGGIQNSFNTGLTDPHENRPPYMVVAYYTKKT